MSRRKIVFGVMLLLVVFVAGMQAGEKRQIIENDVVNLLKLRQYPDSVIDNLMSVYGVAPEVDFEKRMILGGTRWLVTSSDRRVAVEFTFKEPIIGRTIYDYSTSKKR